VISLAILCPEALKMKASAVIVMIRFKNMCNPLVNLYQQNKKLLVVIADVIA